jgi:hypothetical protein
VAKKTAAKASPKATVVRRKPAVSKAD